MRRVHGFTLDRRPEDDVPGPRETGHDQGSRGRHPTEAWITVPTFSGWTAEAPRNPWPTERDYRAMCRWEVTMTENARGTPDVASDTAQVSPTQKTGERLRELHDNADKTPEEILDEQ